MMGLVAAGAVAMLTIALVVRDLFVHTSPTARRRRAAAAAVAWASGLAVAEGGVLGFAAPSLAGGAGRWVWAIDLGATAVGSVLLGRLGDRYDRRWATGGALLVAAAAMALAGAAGNGWQLLMAATVMGAPGGYRQAGPAFARALAADHPWGRQWLIASNAPVVITLAVSGEVGLSWALGGLAVAMAALAVAIVCLIDEDPGEKTSGPWLAIVGRLAADWRDRDTRRLYVVVVCGGVVLGLVSGSVPHVLAAHGFGLQARGWFRGATALVPALAAGAITASIATRRAVACWCVGLTGGLVLWIGALPSITGAAFYVLALVGIGTLQLTPYSGLFGALTTSAQRTVADGQALAAASISAVFLTGVTGGLFAAPVALAGGMGRVVACATLVGLVGLAVLVDALRRPAVQVVTVVVVDMVASGRIVAERDPMCAYELLAAERARIVALARGAGGAHRRDVENTGDGAIVRFNSPDRALEFCRAVMAPRADGPRYRLGASLGPIAVGPDGVVGMAVWEAVSLCASASPGSALIAGSVRGGLGAERAAGLAPHAPVEVKHIRTIGVHLLIPGDKAPAAPAVPPASCEGGRRRARRAAARNRGGRDASR